MRTLLVAVLSLVTIAPAVPAAAAEAPRRPISAVVVDPGSRAYGHTYGEWSARWWQYVLSIPVNRNPLTDTTGRRCGERQSGPVFFLGAEYNHFRTVNRTCRVPAGKALFFPVINCKNDNTVPIAPAGQTQPGPNHDKFDTLLTGCRNFINGASELSAELDGRAVTGLTLTSAYRASSPAFRVRTPADNLLRAAGDNVGRQTITPVAADGVYLMLRPLRRGTHTLRFQAHYGTAALDVTYRLRVS